MQNYHCLITHSDGKNGSHTIDRDNDDDVVTEVSTEEEEDSEEDLIREGDEGREGRGEDRVLSSSLKEAGEGDESVLINRKIH